MNPKTPSYFERLAFERLITQVENDIRAGTFDHAATLKKLTELLPHLNNPPEVMLRLRAMHALGVMYLMERSYDQARAILGEAGTLAHVLKQTLWTLKVYNRLAAMDYMAGDVESAARAYAQALELVSDASATGETFDELFSLMTNYGSALYSLGRYEEAEANLDGAIMLFERKETATGRNVQRNAIVVSNAHLILARIYMARGEHDRAREKSLLTHEICQQLNSPVRLLPALMLMLNGALHAPQPPQSPERCWESILALLDEQRDNASVTGVMANLLLQEAVEWVRLYGMTTWVPQWAERLAREGHERYLAINNAAGAAQAAGFLASLKPDATVPEVKTTPSA